MTRGRARGQIASGDDARAGLLYAGGAFLAWGLVPIYFRALGRVSPLEIIAHRVLWSVLLLAVVQGVRRSYGKIRALFRQPRAVAGLALSSALLTTNWLAFVWAVNAGRVLETSLGYFLTPASPSCWPLSRSASRWASPVRSPSRSSGRASLFTPWTASGTTAAPTRIRGNQQLVHI
jgi:hypothetical protein